VAARPARVYPHLSRNMTGKRAPSSPGRLAVSRASGFLNRHWTPSPLLTVGEAEARSPRRSGVPHLRQWGHRRERCHAEGPADRMLGEEATPPPSPHQRRPARTRRREEHLSPGAPSRCPATHFGRAPS